MERTCKKCGEIKPIEEFVPDKRRKNGHTNVCTSCNNERCKLRYYKAGVNEYSKQYRKLHEQVLKEKRKRYYKLNKEDILLKQKICYKKNETKRREAEKAYRIVNREKIRAWGKQERVNNPNRFKNYYKKHRSSHHDHCLQLARKRYQENKEEIHIKNKESSKMLKNSYLLALFCQHTGISRRVILLYPDLIESYRQQLKVKRLIKSKKNDKSTETS